MVVGDQHLQTQSLCLGHAIDTGNAVVHRDQQLRTAGMYALRNRRCEPVTVYHAVRHDEVHVLRAQQGESAQTYRARCRAVAVVISDDAQALLCVNRIGQ